MNEESEVDTSQKNLVRYGGGDVNVDEDLSGMIQGIGRCNKAGVTLQGVFDGFSTFFRLNAAADRIVN